MKTIEIKAYNEERELLYQAQHPEHHLSYDNILPSLFAREFVNNSKITYIEIERK